MINYSTLSKSTFIKSTFSQLKLTVTVFAILTTSATSIIQVNAVLPTVENTSTSLNSYQPDSASNSELSDNTSFQTFQTIQPVTIQSVINQPVTQPVNSSGLSAQYDQLSNTSTTLFSVDSPVISSVNNTFDASINNSVNSPVTSFANNPVTIAPASNRNVDKQVMVYVVSVDASGQEQLIPVTSTTRVKSGDILEYQTKLTNTTSDQISTITVSVTIPKEVDLVGKVTPENASGSADGSNFQQMPIKAEIESVVQDLPLEYYTSVRWNLSDLNLNETTMVSYRAKFK